MNASGSCKYKSDIAKSYKKLPSITTSQERAQPVATIRGVNGSIHLVDIIYVSFTSESKSATIYTRIIPAACGSWSVIRAPASYLFVELET